jgi:hypothetical protein
LAEIQRSWAMENHLDFYSGEGEEGSHEFFEWVGINIEV